MSLVDEYGEGVSQKQLDETRKYAAASGSVGPTIKDSGERQSFASGMVRDVTTGKTNYALVLDGPMFERWAAHLTAGAKKYAERNWMKASGTAERERFKESALRHFLQWYRGDSDEDHAAAVMFNINGKEYVDARTKVNAQGFASTGAEVITGVPGLPTGPSTLAQAPAVEGPPHRPWSDERGCPVITPRGSLLSLGCERQEGHSGKHMAWADYPNRILYPGGAW